VQTSSQPDPAPLLMYALHYCWLDNVETVGIYTSLPAAQAVPLPNSPHHISPFIEEFVADLFADVRRTFLLDRDGTWKEVPVFRVMTKDRLHDASRS
jgi:hypothetical protein